MDGPAADEADAVLKINLTAIAFNWATLATEADCAAVLECNAYGCGIDPVADALAKSGCGTFFVTNLAEARRVRAVAPKAVIYVLHGLHAGAAPHRACRVERLRHCQPVDGRLRAERRYRREQARTVAGGGGSPVSEVGFLDHGITLLMSSLARAEKARDPQSERQVAWFDEVRRLYRGVPASLAGASAILRRWVSLSGDRALVVGPAGDRRHRLARCQGGMRR
jgi:alanine racemase